MLFKTIIFCCIYLASFAALSTTTPINKTATKQMATKTYDAKGKLVQKTTANGRHYNAQGQYIGKNHPARSAFMMQRVVTPGKL